MKLALTFLFTFLLAAGYAQKPKAGRTEQTSANSRPKNLSDSALLDLVQKQTFRYFWDFAHPVSGMARERSNKTKQYGDEVVAVGGTGFGIMSLIVATERKWISRDQAVERMTKLVDFLL